MRHPPGLGVAGRSGHDLGAVGESIGTLERRGSPVHRLVAADGVGVATTVIGGEVLPGHRTRRVSAGAGTLRARRCP